MQHGKRKLVKAHINKYKLRQYIAVLIVGLLYYIWIRLGSAWIPCPFRKVSTLIFPSAPAGGYLCPGCGVTGMLVSILRGDLAGAYHCNQFLFVTLPYVIYVACYAIYHSLADRRPSARSMKWNGIIASLYVLALIIWCVVRNLYL